MKTKYWNLYKIGTTVYLLLVGVLGALLPLVSFTTNNINPQQSTSHISVGYFGIWDESTVYWPISNILSTLGIITIISFSIVLVVDAVLIPRGLIKAKWMLSVKNAVYAIAVFGYIVSYYLLTVNINNYLKLTSLDPANFVPYSPYDYYKFSFGIQIKSITPAFSLSYYMLKLGLWVLISLPIIRSFLTRNKDNVV